MQTDYCITLTVRWPEKMCSAHVGTEALLLICV